VTRLAIVELARFRGSAGSSVEVPEVPEAQAFSYYCMPEDVRSDPYLAASVTAESNVVEALETDLHPLWGRDRGWDERRTRTGADPPIHLTVTLAVSLVSNVNQI